MNIIACDPGWSGGFACESGTSRMPDSPHGIVKLLSEWKEFGSVLVIEQVGGFAGEKMPGSRMFSFGENFGLVVGAAIALNYRVERVHPQKWIKAHSLGTRSGLKKSQWKAKLRSRAAELYPLFKVTLDNADALLILDAARRGLI